MDPALERVIARLEARFDAALAREDEHAAADLRVSLQQDRALAEMVRAGTGMSVLTGEGAALPVSVVGADYCGGGVPLSWLWRLGSAPLIVDESLPAPDLRGDSLQEVAGRWARGGRRVDLGLEMDQLRGRLVRTGPDNLVIDATGGRVIVPLWLVRSIRLVHGG